MVRTKDFPNRSSGPIPGDPFGRTYAELDHWYKQHGSSLQQQCVVEMKKALLQLGRSGAPRPAKHYRLMRYTNPQSSTYDPKFDAEIRALRRDWFASPTDIKREKQMTLLERARNGQPKPQYGTKLSTALRTYICKTSGCYDPSFTTKIRALRPDWFANPANAKKEEILELAASGKPRPVIRTKLGAGLQRYIRQKSNTYDREFDAKIRALRPDWFVDSAVVNKEVLLKLAHNRKPRPLATTKIGSRLTDYANPIRRTYDPDFDKEIRASRPDWFVNSADVRKKTLLELARSGKLRPPSSTKMGVGLVNYTRPKGGCYDLDFDAEIRTSRPDWFERPVVVRKTAILELARTGKPRPPARTRIGERLSSYTRPKSKYYDLTFDTEIRALRPDWFTATPGVKFVVRKKTLLELARTGKPRPSARTRIGACLSSFAALNHKNYDPDFAAEIRELRPDWFMTDVRKKELLELARTGKPRPPARTRIGRRLSNYAFSNRKCYDPDFAAEIRELRPDWFVSSADTHKTALIKLAKRGRSRPCASQLGYALSRYTRTKSGSYDPSFDKEIRALRPNWFPSIVTNKEKLLSLASNGGERPSSRAHNAEEMRLGRALVYYTSERNRTRNPVFDKQIRQSRPDWFVNTADLRKAELLRRARNGMSKPSRNACDIAERRLGGVLANYTIKRTKTYDPVFDKEIRQLRPDWFDPKHIRVLAERSRKILHARKRAKAAALA